MKKKNEREQELDQKEFENELDRDLSHQYDKLNVKEKFFEGKNKFVIGAMNFFSTLIFFGLFYWLVKYNINYFTYGFTSEFFETMDPFIHLAVLILSINSVIQKRSAVEGIIDNWPF